MRGAIDFVRGSSAGLHVAYLTFATSGLCAEHSVIGVHWGGGRIRAAQHIYIQTSVFERKHGARMTEC